MDDDAKALLQLEATHDQVMVDCVQVYDSWDLEMCMAIDSACRRLASSSDYRTRCIGNLALAGLVETIIRSQKREADHDGE